MNDWMAHLKAQQGVLENGHDWRFPTDEDLEPATTAWLSPLSHLTILECEGADAARFLQGQMSANVEHADGRFAPLTAFSTPKGRMLANAEVLKVAENRYWLLLATSLAEPLSQQLNKFAPFYKTTLTRRDDIVLIGLVGEPMSMSQTELPDLPTNAWQMSQNKTALALRQPGPRPRWLLALDEASAIEQWNRLAVDLPVAGNRLWKREDIDAGLAWLDAARLDSYLPQMLNWEALGGVSFRKGCYTGQEIVARAHFRGQVKRRLQIATLCEATPPLPGTEIRDADGKRVGELFQAIVKTTGDACHALVILNTGKEAEPLSLEGRALTIEPLPYPLERLDPETLVDA
ncbi:YgfZ/GcvT domain-containing protein [Salinicola aestuarinus]|uniref:CAF17-like 4Fe-4S cluster assembly/insertion protein YgfZ n=1 Tax=Salinicola aestuarinus TaxID=1949082 RepID=UPI000DA13427|nr:folate-binding protein YgfZ [Salinicola aestuarinus]